MADPHIDGPYGDFGRATYDENTQTWHFARDDLKHDYNFTEAGDAVTSQQNGAKHADSSSKNASTSTRAQQIEEVLSLLPELMPVQNMLAPLLHVSEEVNKAAQRHDHTIGSRIAIGQLYDQALNARTSFIAWTSGEIGSNITISRLQHQRQGWNDSAHVWFDVPMPYGRRAHWTGPGVALRQLCFTQNVKDTNPLGLIAARLLDRTVIFQLTSTTDTPVLQEVHEVLPEADANSHAHVAFNSWYTRQYAIADCTGVCNVWQVDGRVKLKPSQVAEVKVTQAIDGTLQDGWHRALWVHNASTLAVCSRTSASLFDMANNGVKLQDIDVSCDQSDCWILDTAVHNEQPDYLFVLTGTSILAFRIIADAQGTVMRKVLDVRHYLNRRDLTLRISLVVTKDVTVILKSCIAPICLWYKIGKLGDNEETIAGPFHVSTSFKGSQYADQDVLIMPVKGGNQPGADTSRTICGTLQQKSEVTFSMLYLDAQFELRQSLAYILSDKTDLLSPREPDWRMDKRHRGSTRRYDDIVNDHDDESDAEHLTIRRPVSDFAKRAQKYSDERIGPQWTSSLALLAGEIDKNPSSKLPDFCSAINKLRRKLEAGQVDDDTGPYELLSELGSSSTIIGDIDQATTVLQHLLERTLNSDSNARATYTNASLAVRSLPLPICTGLPPLTDINHVYDNIVADYIRPLSEDVPGRIRLAKEKLARQVAAVVVLASHVLRIEHASPTTNLQEEASQPFSQLSHLSLPIRGMLESTPPRRTRANTAAEALKTQSIGGAQSETTSASRVSSQAPHSYYIDSIVTCSAPLPTTFSRSTQRILRHWNLASDPNDYDWRTASRKINRQIEEEDLETQMTDKDRARQQRHAERQLKRYQREQMASQQAQMSSQPFDLLVSASQPVLMDNPGIDHQANVPSSRPLPASQAVAGRYGGKPAKKKRRQGF